MTTPVPEYDFAVIGAGIAGASVAAELVAGDNQAAVVVLEMEDRPGYHTTGRSAAMFVPGYGPRPIRALTRASADFFGSPPDGFCDVDLLSPRNIMMIARPDQVVRLDAMIDELSQEAEVTRISGEEAQGFQPILRRGYCAAAMLDTSGSDIDVDAVHQGYLRRFRSAGGKVLARAGVTAMQRKDGVWHLETGAGPIVARGVINAAGAWADKVGAMARAEHIGLVPKRRTAMVIAVPDELPDGPGAADWPLVVDIDEQFYMKPDAGRLLISPANEDPADPSDVQPEELDIAICIDRIERAFDIRVGRIETRWAGLRSFVADKAPVAGFSQQVDGFFWLAGQGGYGIQSAPALARFAAARLLGHEVPADILAQGLDAGDLSPARLMESTDEGA